MKIASASSILISETIRKDAGIALAAGQQVFIEPPSDHFTDSIASVKYAQNLQKEINAGIGGIKSVHFDEGARRELNVAGIAIGGVAGTLVGASIGVILDQLRAVHPTSAVAFDAACAVIGGVLGGAVGSGQCSLEGTYDKGKFGVKIAPITPK